VSKPKQLKRRSRSEIISSILDVTNGNRARITEIQFKTYLSYNLVKEYLLYLLKSGLIEYIEGERSFKTTPKGMQALEVYNKMDELFVPKTANDSLELTTTHSSRS
jgi:predicted transcriptional regulator